MMRCLAVLTLLACPFVCSAQTFNINFGATPIPADYAAAGFSGHWNTTPGTQGTTYSLNDVTGATTGVTFSNIGGSAINTQNSGATGNASRLLREYLVTFTPTLEVCIFVSGLQPGTYQVITYGNLENGPASLVSVDQSGEPNVLVGGAWPGDLTAGVTHAVHLANVTTGSLGLHSGIPSGGSPAIAALNGLQLIRIPDSEPFLRGDANHDGARNIADAVQILVGLFAGPVPDSCPDASDVNDDDSVDIADPVALLAHLFTTGAPLPVPFASCGDDPTLDPLHCSAFAACP